MAVISKTVQNVKLYIPRIYASPLFSLYITP